MNLFGSKSSLFIAAATWATLALATDILALLLGLGRGSASAPGYLSFHKPAWMLFPFFFIVLAAFAHVTWQPFLRAWLSLPKNGALYRSNQVETDQTAIEPFVAWLAGTRRQLVWTSVALGLLLTAWDADCLWYEYLSSHPLQTCPADFTVAYRLHPPFREITKSANGAFVVIAYALQGGLIALALLTLLQITVHGLLFAVFERLRLARDRSLSIKLNPNDPLREFGLASFNRAINTVYILLAIAMLLPVLSAFGQPAGSATLGQLLFRCLLPLILLAPLVIPIVDRFFRIEEVATRIREMGDSGQGESFSKQSLWPTDKTQVAYIGKVMLAISAAGYLYVLFRSGEELIKKLLALFG